jgi:hypothetical protein
MLTTGSSCGELLASGPPADHGALGGTGGATMPHPMAASAEWGECVPPVGNRPGPPPTVPGQDTVVEDEVDARTRRQRRELFQQLDKLEQERCCAVAPLGFEV